MTRLGLTKTSLRNARQERFDFLGYSFGPHWFKANGKWCLGAGPSKKSIQRSAFRGIDRYVYERVRDFLARRHKVAGRGTKRFSCEVVYGERGLLRLERLPLAAPSRALR
jgi:RNA-directed DNA polymerase